MRSETELAMLGAIATAIGIASAAALFVGVSALVCRALKWAPINVTVHIHNNRED